MIHIVFFGLLRPQQLGAFIPEISTKPPGFRRSGRGVRAIPTHLCAEGTGSPPGRNKSKMRRTGNPTTNAHRAAGQRALAFGTRVSFGSPSSSDARLLLGVDQPNSRLISAIETRSVHRFKSPAVGQWTAALLLWLRAILSSNARIRLPIKGPWRCRDKLVP